jgi:hypothetical protein
MLVDFGPYPDRTRRHQAMKMLKALAATAFAASAAITTPASAITGDWVADNVHTYVGLAVFYDENGEFLQRCSGTLISATKFLTAGHCTVADVPIGYARIYFQQDAGAHFDPVTQHDPVSGYPDDCAGKKATPPICVTSHSIHNFNYTDGALPNTHDVGLLLLDQRASGLGVGSLPAAGTLDALATARGTQDTVFTVSGYGLTYKPQTNSGQAATSFRSRLMAEEIITNLGSALNDGYNLQTQGNGDDRGGTCNGDSGGPVFLGHLTESKVIVAVTSFGLNELCRGTDFGYRIDRQEVLDWINSF